MAHRQRTIGDARLHIRGKFQQSQQVSDVAARFVDDLGQRFLRMAIFAGKPLIRLRLFDRVEVLALDILDQRDLERLRIVEVADDDGHLMQPGPLRRTPAAFTPATI